MAKYTENHLTLVPKQNSNHHRPRTMNPPFPFMKALIATCVHTIYIISHPLQISRASTVNHLENTIDPSIPYLKIASNTLRVPYQIPPS
jgi:hypothetical protein